MIQVQDTVDKLYVIGHASDDVKKATHASHDVCVAVTALIKMLVISIPAIGGDNPPMTVKPGKFILTKKALSVKSQILIEAFLDTIKSLSAEYHQYVRLYDEKGNEITDFMKDVESDSDKVFPDWRDYVVGK